jgi:Alpha galactosidase A/Alpha galactosidase C-terminal beta sandwich domain
MSNARQKLAHTSSVVVVSLIAVFAYLSMAAGARAATRHASGRLQARAVQPGRAAADPTPVMGWSSWSFLRFGIDTQRIEQEADAMVSTGLVNYGYNHINIDDNWYVCPGPQGPDVDSYGRWVVDSSEFPNVGSENGIAAVAAYVHHLGLKFGIYETAGISKQAVAENTPVLGSDYTADQIASTTKQANYDCGGMVDLDYSQPGAQAYVDSVVDELASWGVDYIKLDGITDKNTADIKAWSDAISQSGRTMALDTTEGQFNTKLAPTLDQYANQWEFSPDIEINGPDEGSADGCNAAPYTGCLSVFPFTSYSWWFDRFNAVAKWQPYGGPGGFNDYDSIEVGDGETDSGMSQAAEQSQLSLWALGSAPFILGVNLSNSVTNAFGSSDGLTPSGLAMLTNRAVIAVDQDAIDASRIKKTTVSQVFSKIERGGDAVVGLFDTDQTSGAQPEQITTKASKLGLPASPDGYRVHDLWTDTTETISSAGKIAETVQPEGVALLRVTPIGGAG